MGVIRKSKSIFPLLLGMAVVIGMLPVIPIKAEEGKPPDIVVESAEAMGEDKEETVIKGEEVEKPDAEAEQPGLPEQMPSEPQGHPHDADCGFVEAQPEIACDHQCKEVDKDEKIIHLKDCTYRPEIISAPCKWEITEEEKEPPVEEEEDPNQPEKDKEDSDNPTKPPKQEDEDAEKPTVEGEIKPEVPEPDKPKEEGTKEESVKEDVTKKDIVEEEVTEDEVTEETQESDSEDTLGPGENEAAFLVRIPSHVFISETSQSFDVETEKVGQLPEGAVIITVEGTASEKTGNFALYRDGDPDKCYEYQLQMGEQILTSRQNKMIIDQEIPGQSMTVIPVDQPWELPAGNYQGTLTFRVSYEPAE